MVFAGPLPPVPSATTPFASCSAGWSSGTRSYQYQFAPPALSGSSLRYTATPIGVGSVMLAYSSLTAAAPWGHAPVPPALAAILSFDQMRLKPCGDGFRDGWIAGSAAHDLNTPDASQSSIAS